MLRMLASAAVLAEHHFPKGFPPSTCDDALFSYSFGFAVIPRIASVSVCHLINSWWEAQASEFIPRTHRASELKLFKASHEYACGVLGVQIVTPRATCPLLKSEQEKLFNPCAMMPCRLLMHERSFRCVNIRVDKLSAAFPWIELKTQLSN